MALTDFLGNLNFISIGGIFGLILSIVIIIIALMIITGIIWFFLSRKKYNLTVEFKLPRGVKYLTGDENDLDNIEGTIEAEHGKGIFNALRGVVFLKRKGKKKIAMKPFSVNKYLQPSNKKPILTVIQTGIDTYIPVMPSSYLLFEDENTKEKLSVLNIVSDTTASKSWRSHFEREAKSTYSIQGALVQLLQNPLFLVGLVIFLWGIQILIIYNRLRP